MKQMTYMYTQFVNFMLGAHTHTHTHTQPFYGSLSFVRDNPGEPVPEETFTYSHLSWSSFVQNWKNCNKIACKRMFNCAVFKSHAKLALAS